MELARSGAKCEGGTQFSFLHTHTRGFDTKKLGGKLPFRFKLGGRSFFYGKFARVQLFSSFFSRAAKMGRSENVKTGGGVIIFRSASVPLSRARFPIPFYSEKSEARPNQNWWFSKKGKKRRAAPKKNIRIQPLLSLRPKGEKGGGEFWRYSGYLSGCQTTHRYLFFFFFLYPPTSGGREEVKLHNTAIPIFFFLGGGRVVSCVVAA